MESIVPQRRSETSSRRVTIQKTEKLISTAAEALDHARIKVMLDADKNLIHSIYTSSLSCFAITV